MANAKQIERLEQGAEGWNKWRAEHPDVRIDLSGAKLSQANLSWFDLSRAEHPLKTAKSDFLL